MPDDAFIAYLRGQAVPPFTVTGRDDYDHEWLRELPWGAEPPTYLFTHDDVIAVSFDEFVEAEVAALPTDPATLKAYREDRERILVQSIAGKVHLEALLRKFGIR